MIIILIIVIYLDFILVQTKSIIVLSTKKDSGIDTHQKWQKIKKINTQYKCFSLLIAKRNRLIENELK